MEDQKDYTQDIIEIRSMMERSTKFPSLSGLAGILAGVYALGGAYIVYFILDFRPVDGEDTSANTAILSEVIIVALSVLLLAVGTAVFLAAKKVARRGEKMWNASSRRLLVNLAIPLVAGGTFMLILLSKNQLALLAPMSLLFYGIALYGASKFTEDEIKALGLVQMTLGLISAYYSEYGIAFWAIGFGVVHVVYGIIMYFANER